MTIERTFQCDLCKTRLEPRHLVGLYWGAGVYLEERPSRDVEHHLCFPCLSAIQRFDVRCGKGVKDCSQGPRCDREHK